MPDLQRQLSEFERLAELAAAMGAKRTRVVMASIVGEGESRAVALFFRHDDFPDVLFAYRCMAPGSDVHERVWLAEELATGALHRLLRDEHPLPAADGVIWLRLGGAVLVATGAREQE